MSRRHIAFACENARLAGTLDSASGTSGLLIVSGGNEIRAGAFAGMAELAARLAAAGYPVFRFDRRGVGDSAGENLGFRTNQPDIAAAAATFLVEMPQLERIIGFGICDAASALMLAGGASCTGLVLANPWTIESDDAAPPPSAIRARYAEKLRNPREVLRLLKGQVSLGKLARGISRALSRSLPSGSLVTEMRQGLERFSGPVRILLAERDRTAQAFEAVWDSADPRIARCPDSSHAFVEPHARDWLYERLVAALSE